MKYFLHLLALIFAVSCSTSTNSRIPIIVDTDANNELDDQHALAYLFFNTKIFDIKGITTNSTYKDTSVDGHYNEAQRVMQLCNVQGNYPLLAGAKGSFDDIAPNVGKQNFDGSRAVDFIVESALANKNGKLVVAAIGKLTNVALAVHKEPRIKNRIRVVWLGSNYPKGGEYNLMNDVEAVNYLLNQDVDFEIITVRYGETSGSGGVKVSSDEILRRLSGKGPKVAPVTGRDGGQFATFGDYSMNLFSKSHPHGNSNQRALFDVVALAIIKNPQWGVCSEIPAPHIVEGQWQQRPNNEHSVKIWENFDSASIIADFFESLE